MSVRKTIQKRWWALLPIVVTLALVGAGTYTFVQHQHLRDAARAQALTVAHLDDVQQVVFDLQKALKETSPEAQRDVWSYYYAAFQHRAGRLHTQRLSQPALAFGLQRAENHLQQAATIAPGQAPFDPTLEAILALKRGASLLRADVTTLHEQRHVRAGQVVLLFWWAYIFLFTSALAIHLNVHVHRKTEAAVSVLYDLQGRLPRKVKDSVHHTIVGAFFDHARVGIAVIDAEGRIVQSNPALRQMLGYPADKLEGQRLTQLFKESPGKETHTLLEAHPTAQVFKRKDGQDFVGQVSLTTVRDAEEQAQYSFAVIEDVGEQARRAEALRAAERKAEEMTYVKDTFIANMNHELRTPLTAILGFSSILEEEVAPPQQELVQAIRESGNRLMDTVSSVLEFARLEADEAPHTLVPLDLRHHVSKPLGALKLKAQEKGIRLSFHTPSAPVMVEGDAPGLERIIYHLVDNAVKFTEKGFVTVTVKTEGEQAFVYVRDTGIGIDAAYKPHLYEAFRQGTLGDTRAHNGTGIGLALTQKLVASMNGTLEIDSEAGRGTRVMVAFDRVQPQEQPRTFRRAA